MCVLRERVLPPYSWSMQRETLAQMFTGSSGDLNRRYDLFFVKYRFHPLFTWERSCFIVLRGVIRVFALPTMCFFLKEREREITPMTGPNSAVT